MADRVAVGLADVEEAGLRAASGASPLRDRIECQRAHASHLDELFREFMTDDLLEEGCRGPFVSVRQWRARGKPQPGSNDWRTCCFFWKGPRALDNWEHPEETARSGFDFAYVSRREGDSLVFQAAARSVSDGHGEDHFHCTPDAPRTDRRIEPSASPSGTAAAAAATTTSKSKSVSITRSNHTGEAIPEGKVLFVDADSPSTRKRLRPPGHGTECAERGEPGNGGTKGNSDHGSRKRLSMGRALCAECRSACSDAMTPCCMGPACSSAGGPTQLCSTCASIASGLCKTCAVIAVQNAFQARGRERDTVRVVVSMPVAGSLFKPVCATCKGTLEAGKLALECINRDACASDSAPARLCHVCSERAHGLCGACSQRAEDALGIMS